MCRHPGNGDSEHDRGENEAPALGALPAEPRFGYLRHATVETGLLSVQRNRRWNDSTRRWEDFENCRPQLFLGSADRYASMVYCAEGEYDSQSRIWKLVPIIGIRTPIAGYESWVLRNGSILKDFYIAKFRSSFTRCRRRRSHSITIINNSMSTQHCGRLPEKTNVHRAGHLNKNTERERKRDNLRTQNYKERNEGERNHTVRNHTIGLWYRCIKYEFIPGHYHWVNNALDISILRVLRSIYLSIYLSKKSRLGRRKCRDTTRAPNNVN